VKSERCNIAPIPDYGKVPPQAVDMEEAVLGSMMLGGDTSMNVTAILKPECFYKEASKNLFCNN
jgi:replicative DNA helicase